MPYMVLERLRVLLVCLVFVCRFRVVCGVEGGVRGGFRDACVGWGGLHLQRLTRAKHGEENLFQAQDPPISTHVLDVSGPVPFLLAVVERPPFHLGIEGPKIVQKTNLAFEIITVPSKHPQQPIVHPVDMCSIGMKRFLAATDKV